MGDKHFPWRPVHLYAFPTTPCVCLFAAGGFRRPSARETRHQLGCMYVFSRVFLVVHRSVNTSARHISGHKGASVGSSSTKFFDDFFFFFFPCLCHSLFLPPLMRFLHIIIVYNWIEILPMRGCCCVHVEDVTWAPTDGLFIFRCSE